MLMLVLRCSRFISRYSKPDTLTMNLEQATESLFSYGTLQRESVQIATFGRTLEGRRDALTGYRPSVVPIKSSAEGDKHYRNAEFTGEPSDVVEGMVFLVSKNELYRADVYEQIAEYKRQRVQLKSGDEAWIYVHSPE